MLRLTQLKLPIRHSREDLKKAIIKRAGGKVPKSFRITKRSIDARKKPELFYIYTIEASFPNENIILRNHKSNWVKAEKINYRFPYRIREKEIPDHKRPVIVGSGPAGLFAGLILARNGFCPVIFERGDSVDIRQKKVSDFWDSNIADPESNVQFGEGGAGTFSDGKLNTLVKDRYGRNRFVLEEFVRHGAPEEILYDAKPHIGTDFLKKVVASIREEIKTLGGEFHFRTKVLSLLLNTDAVGKQSLTGIMLDKEGTMQEWHCENVILAIGHSARDTFYMLKQSHIPMSAKAFAIGVRVEHPAEMINISQYGDNYPDFLSAAAYKLTHQCRNGRGIYSFCMCPGGYVVNASSEPGHLCVNGMSYHGRGNSNSNSAIIATVTPEDFSSLGAHVSDPLAGVEFQRKYEALAYHAGRGKIPVQLYGDFLAGKTSRGFGGYLPSTKGEYCMADLHACLPEYICQSLTEGLEAFGKKIAGYNREDAILLGVETRTSSPIRIERDKNGQSRTIGLFPCGEGAGYAGGITSAAMDGLKMAEAVAEKIMEM